MTNFIYIFMIITLICIGAGIKAFNSEDSDTKTTIKNIPNGIKKVLLIGTNVQKTDITILIGTIIYLMFTIGVICIYVFASHETKVELQYKLCVAFLVMLFLETFIVVSVSYREKKTQNKAIPKSADFSGFCYLRKISGFVWREVEKCDFVCYNKTEPIFCRLFCAGA